MEGCSQVHKWVQYGRNIMEITLENALHAPDLSHNLVSLQCLVCKGVRIDLKDNGATMRDSVPFLRCTMKGAMFIVPFIPPLNALATRSLNQPANLKMWHHCLAHVSKLMICNMVQRDIVEGLAITKMSVSGKCKDCILSKHARHPFDTCPDTEATSYKHMAFDIWGLAHVQITGRKTLMLVMTDQAGAECATWYLVNKVAETTVICLEGFDTQAKTQWGYRVKCICTDRGTKFNNKLWKAYCWKQGIVHETTALHSLPANRVAERRNRTILDLARSMLCDS